MLTYITSLDFGYTWPWTCGHLLIALLFGLTAAALHRWLPKIVRYFLYAGAVWGLSAFFIVHFVFGFNRPLVMPTSAFLSQNTGTVLDVGCGSGRTTLMVGMARPGVQLVSLDIFEADYLRDHGYRLLQQNLEATGLSQRTRILRADMRQIPSGDESFDGVVSSYAVDHLRSADMPKALREIRRVLRPNGELLLMLINNDAWLKWTYGPLPSHHFHSGDWWQRQLREAGFELRESGTSPGSMHFLCRKREGPVARNGMMEAYGPKEGGQ